MKHIEIEESETSYRMKINGIEHVVGSGVDMYWTLAAIDDRTTPHVYLPGDLAKAGDRDLTGEAVDLGTACDYFLPFVQSAGDA